MEQGQGIAEDAESSQPTRAIAAWLSRIENRVALGLLILGLLSLPFLVRDFTNPVLQNGDGAIYQLTAQSVLDGEGYSYLGEAFSIRPPGFSLLLIRLRSLPMETNPPSVTA